MRWLIDMAREFPLHLPGLLSALALVGIVISVVLGFWLVSQINVLVP